MGEARRRFVRHTFVALLLLLVAVPASAQEVGPPVDLGVYGDPIRFEAAPGTTLTLDSGRRLVDTLEIRSNPNSDGLVVIADLTTDTYVEGVAEMPARWPLEALKAQAIAARTYAWYQIELGTFPRRGLGYDICATTACQVFRGREVVETPEVGKRWAQAVAETSGEVLTFDGGPILARYFSTSGGQTRNNEDIFASEGPFPYLKGFDDPFDEVSPLHTWQATFSREAFDDLLSRGNELGAVVPVASVDVQQRGGGQPDLVTVTSTTGDSATVSAGAFKDFLNEVAPEVYPNRYPGERSDGNRLPSTLPSSRYEVIVGPDEVVVDGSGWGHGVGMGQYGALGRAEAGQTTEEILAAYYNGLSPTTPAALPERVRVGLADTISGLGLSADGPMRVVVGDTVIAEQAVGDWQVDDAGSRTIAMTAPAGYGSPLVVSPVEIGRRQVFTSESVVADLVVNKSARASLVISDEAGAIEAEEDLGVVEAGRRAFEVGPRERALAPGSYTVTYRVVDESGAVAEQSSGFDVRALPDVPPTSLLSNLTTVAPAAPPDVRPAPIAAATLGGLMVGAAMSSRRRHRTDDPA